MTKGEARLGLTPVRAARCLKRYSDTDTGASARERSFNETHPKIKMESSFVIQSEISKFIVKYITVRDWQVVY